MTVASTPTTTDRNRDKIELEAKITALNSVKDTAERETKHAVKSADLARDSLKSVETHLADLLTIIPNVTRETHEHIAYCTSVMRDCSNKMVSMLDIAVLIEKRAHEATQALEKTIQEAKTIHETAVAEEKTMQRNRADLDVYHDRLKEYFAKHLPDQQIIL